MVVDACWVQHGGSGLNLDYETAWGLEWDELVSILEMIGHRRQRESDALKRARGGR